MIEDIFAYKQLVSAKNELWKDFKVLPLPTPSVQCAPSNFHLPFFICNGYGESILKANWMSEIIFHNLVGKMMAVVERAKFRVGLKFKILFG